MPVQRKRRGRSNALPLLLLLLFCVPKHQFGEFCSMGLHVPHNHLEERRDVIRPVSTMKEIKSFAKELALTSGEQPEREPRMAIALY